MVVVDLGVDVLAVQIDLEGTTTPSGQNDKSATCNRGHTNHKSTLGSPCCHCRHRHGNATDAAHTIVSHHTPKSVAGVDVFRLSDEHSWEVRLEQAGLPANRIRVASGLADSEINVVSLVRHSK